MCMYALHVEGRHGEGHHIHVHVHMYAYHILCTGWHEFTLIT